MRDVLTILKDEFEKMNIPYTFDEWDKTVELPQYIGEISEIPTEYENGESEYSFILSGYATNYDHLFDVADRLKREYKPSAIRNGVVIMYDDCKPIDNDTEDLKQVEITLNIKKWSV